MIRALSNEYVSDVARLHGANLSGLLRRLGGSATLAYYRGATRTGLASAFVDVEDGAVTGFVFGSVHPDQLRRGVLRANPVGVLGGACLGVLRHPSSLVWLVKSLRGPDESAYDPRMPELTYLATDVHHRGGGIGRRLVDAFAVAMQDQGAQAYELSVDEDNRAAVAFYERLGFQLAGRYREFGTLHRRYRMDLQRHPGRPTPESS